MPALGAIWEHRRQPGGGMPPIGFGLLPGGKRVEARDNAIIVSRVLSKVTLSYLLYASYLLYLLYAYDTNKTS